MRVVLTLLRLQNIPNLAISLSTEEKHRANRWRRLRGNTFSPLTPASRHRAFIIFQMLPRFNGRPARVAKASPFARFSGRQPLDKNPPTGAFLPGDFLFYSWIKERGSTKFPSCFTAKCRWGSREISHGISPKTPSLSPVSTKSLIFTFSFSLKPQ